ncbi:MAG: hypothetical protein M0014_14930 [Actinomycetota bacterium]|nr:hypothetical protein [Actinomycetota bacterium]
MEHLVVFLTPTEVGVKALRGCARTATTRRVGVPTSVARWGNTNRATAAT